jgi:hypothetical protein
LFFKSFEAEKEDNVEKIIKEQFISPIIICEENIIGRYFDETTLKIQLLKQIYPNAIVIIFIRNQISLLESRYSLHIKFGGTLRFEEMINGFIKSKRIKQWYYYDYLRKYIDVFGQENVHVYLFEDFVSNFDVFMDSFVKKYDLVVRGRIKKRKANMSYNKNLLFLARFTNQFSKTQISFKNPTKYYYFHIPYFHQISHIIYRGLNAVMPYRRFQMFEHLDKQTYEDLYNYFKEDNKLLMNTFHLPLDKYNYPL